jgi:cytochrome c oxidase cbb3-type subunit 2
MPGFPWLETAVVDPAVTPSKMKALRRVGVPYTDEEIAGASAEVQNRSEMDALIAYLQVLGTASKEWK